MILGSVVLVSTGVFAETTYSLKKMTPRVKIALDSRKERFERLNELKIQNIIGEDNRGYVEVLQENNAAQKLVDEENQNRRVIYKAIAEQNELKGSVDIIEKVFAEVKRNKAVSGTSVQLETGDWIVKQ